MNIWEDDLWKVMCFFCFWYLSIFLFVYKWADEISILLINSYFVIKLGSILLATTIQWFMFCGTKYYIVRYKFYNEDEWRVIKFPPIR
jgi:hypothetical protein